MREADRHLDICGTYRSFHWGEKEARRLADAEYWHVVDQIRALASEENPTRPVTLSVDQVEDVHELRIKGGPLLRKNIRVFFFVTEGRRIVVLGCFKKENEGATPPATKKLMHVRRRKYLNGEYGPEE